jgi:cytochrome c-type protein NapC
MASARAKTLVAALIIFAAGIAFAALFNTGVAYTNEMDFCTSCHSMQVNLEEYKQTIHYKNPSGVQTTCADCHVPKQFLPKLVAKIMAAKDVYHEIMGTIDTPEKYEAHRWGMASAVWAKMKSSNSRECLSCHRLENMDLAAQATRSARSKHGNALDDGKTCIDCHKGVAHELPDEPAEATDSAAAAEGGGAK